MNKKILKSLLTITELSGKKYKFKVDDIFDIQDNFNEVIIKYRKNKIIKLNLKNFLYSDWDSFRQEINTRFVLGE